MVTVTEMIDVQGILRGRTTFGLDEVRELQEAVTHDQHKDVTQGIRELLEEIEQGDTSLQKSLAAGIGAYMVGLHADAVNCLQQVKDNGLASYYLANAQVALGQFDEAIKSFDRAIEGGYDAVQSTLLKAGAVRAVGRIDEAEELLRSVAREGATRAEYSYQYGCIYSDRGDTYGAIEYFERAVDIDPHHARALFSLAGINSLHGNDQESIRLYERALSRPPLYLGALLNLGLLYEDSENYRAAAYCFRKVLEVYPNHERAALYLRDIDASHDMYFDEDVMKSQRRLNQDLMTPVTDFELSVRSRNCLQKMGVRNLGDLTELSETDLLGGKNFGETSLIEIREMMESKGLRLGQSAPRDKPRDYQIRNDDLSPQEQALLNRPVADLNLSVRARKCMSRLGINTLAELTSRTPDELLESKNFGVTSLNEVRRKLTDIGIKLRND
ncbi:tetratricopeptide repeat protein [Symmachiella dynata]|uniref:DNA-directed RNA polymerase subunit alpha n=1 Tax=Symmachiella dynata TaxID=2527995 RepID=A0A517ZRS3_9PLAN|nr:tetratricopeptide repeat protein [Symmachiella dynata]QDU45174.1 DNA-directed RNA polymerase subunit alpha [Symmachiella dynata]